MRLCPWSLALASSIPVLVLERVCPRKGFPWPWPWIFFVSLALYLVSSTPPLLNSLISVLACFQHIAKLQKIMANTHAIFKLHSAAQKMAVFRYDYEQN